MSSWPLKGQPDEANVAVVLGKEYHISGDSQRDLVLRTKGKVKIQFGRKFIDLFDGVKLSGEFTVIHEVPSYENIGSENGFYWVQDENTLYVKVGDQVVAVIGNNAEEGDYISFTVLQNLSSNQRDTAKKNVGISFANRQEALDSNAGNGVVLIKDELKAYLLVDGAFYSIVNNTTIDSDQVGGGDTNRYYFDKPITIDIRNNGGPAVNILGDGKNYSLYIGNNYDYSQMYIENGTTYWETNNSTLVIQSPTHEYIKCYNNRYVDINSILTVDEKIVTDRIESSNYGEYTGYAAYIAANGESYIVADHIIDRSAQGIEKTYKELQALIDNGDLTPNSAYVITDFQNPWEITTLADTIETVETDGELNSDRNTRPLRVVAATSTTLLPEASYKYTEDSNTIVEMSYDITPVDTGQTDVDDDGNTIPLTTKGKITYMRDSWNNECMWDFKHYKDSSGNYTFSTSAGVDGSVQNTDSNIVCSNNKLFTVNPVTISGATILNNTLEGTFTNITFPLGLNNSTFIGNWSGTIACGFQNCQAKSIQNCTFDASTITDAVFRNDFTGVDFRVASSSAENIAYLYSTTHKVEVLQHGTNYIVYCPVENMIQGTTFWGQPFSRPTVQGAISNTGNITPITTGTYTVGTNALSYSEMFATNFRGKADEAAQADKWTTPITLNLSGDATGSVSFDGSTTPIDLAVTVVSTGEITADGLFPSQSCTYNIGSLALQYNNAYFCGSVTAGNIISATGNFSGAVTANSFTGRLFGTATQVSNTLSITQGSTTTVYDGSVARAITITNDAIYADYVNDYYVANGSSIATITNLPSINIVGQGSRPYKFYLLRTSSNSNIFQLPSVTASSDTNGLRVVVRKDFTYPNCYLDAGTGNTIQTRNASGTERLEMTNGASWSLVFINGIWYANYSDT